MGGVREGYKTVQKGQGGRLGSTRRVLAAHSDGGHPKRLLGWHIDGAADGGAMAGEASGGELEQEPSGAEAASRATSDVAAAAGIRAD